MCSLSVVLFVFVNPMMALWEQHFLLTDEKGSTFSFSQNCEHLTVSYYVRSSSHFTVLGTGKTI